jgi:hypothetical protein
MRVRQLSVCAFVLLAAVAVTAQAKRAPARKAPAQPAMKTADAEVRCPSELGIGVKTRRNFCDVLTGVDPAEGVIITIPPHRGSVTLTFELHNRHTYSEELITEKRAFRQYTATIGVLTMDNTLVERAVVRSEFRTAADLFDRIEGGAGPGGVKAVAPSGVELITMELPADVGEQVSILGENLRMIRPGGEDFFTAPGRPIATISNVRLQYRPGPAPQPPAAKKAPAKKAPARKAPVKKP